MFGYNLDRQNAYPLRVPLLLLLAAVPAVVIDRLAGRVFGVPLDPALPLIWIGCSQALFRTLHARHADKLYRQLPDALSMIVRSVRAGIPLQEALRGVARESMEPTARVFTRVSDQMAIGIRLDDALRDVVDAHRRRRIRVLHRRADLAGADRRQPGRDAGEPRRGDPQARRPARSAPSRWPRRRAPAPMCWRRCRW